MRKRVGGPLARMAVCRYILRFGGIRMLSVKLDTKIETRLQEISTATGNTPEAIAQAALLAYMEDLEDYAIAVEALREYEANPGENVTLEEMMRELGLDS